MDTIADAIVQIKNAGLVGHEEVLLRPSKQKVAILKVLADNGFIAGWEEKTIKGKSRLVVRLAYGEAKLPNGRFVPKLRGFQRISKPSRRIYKTSAELRPVKNGYGLLVVSTSLGIMSGREARKARLGGETMFAVW